MMRITLTNEMLRLIVDAELCRYRFGECKIPTAYLERLGNDARKRAAESAFRLSHGTSVVDDSQSECARYEEALKLCGEQVHAGTALSKEVLLALHGACMEDVSMPTKLRGPKPAGVLEGVRDPEDGRVEYIPPKAAEIDGLLDELIAYLAESEDHALVKAGTALYQLATIHPFDDANGRVALLAAGHCLASAGFGFGGLSTLEETLAQDPAEYRRKLQMGLPPLCYEGRCDPPHPEIWMEYFLANVCGLAHAALDAALGAPGAADDTAPAHLKPRERAFYDHLVGKGIAVYTPIEMAREFDVSNRTIINWSASLASHGLVEPVLVKERIRSYRTVLPETR